MVFYKNFLGKGFVFLFSVFILISLSNEYCIAKKNNNFKIEVLYFHATIRCEGCLAIEDFTKKSVKSKFANEIKNGKVVLKSLDFLQPKNEHYQKKYNFYVQTLIISKKVKGKEVKWKNLDKIWDYSSNYQQFQDYVEKEIKNLLND